MKKLFLLILLVLSSGIARAQLDFPSELIARETLVTAMQSTQTDPDADLLLIDDQTRVRYETDGTYRYLSDMAYQILTEKGRQEKSSVGIGYDTAYGTARFVRAEVVKPDGRIIAVDLATQSRESINQGQMNSNIYDPNQKEVNLTVPDLEIGDILRYTIAGEQTKAVVPNTWSDLFTLEETFPVLHAVYEVDAPAALPLARIELKDAIPGTVSFRTLENGDRILYTWEARNVPQLFEEPGMPATYTVSQRVLLSTIPDWETLSKWYWNLSKPRLDSVNPAMKEKVSELTAGLTDRQKKIEAIFRFVSQDIRYMGLTVEDEAPGYEPHDVSLTFNNRYGVCRDKAALLVAMLRIAGFDARPVLIYVGPKKDPEVPQPWFNHAITAVRNEDGSWQLMDSTNENTRDLLPGYLSSRSYLVATPEGETLQTSPVVPPEKNLLTMDIHATLDESRRITARAVLAFEGINDTAYRGRLAMLKPEERIPYFEERLKQACGNARLLNLRITPEEVRDTTQPLSVTLDFEVENALADGEESALLQMPTLINHFGLFGRVLGDGIGLDKRRYPLNTGITCGVDETVRLDLRNSSLKPSVLPAYETIDTPELYISRSVSATNDLLVSRAKILLRTVEFSPEQYLTLKQNLKASERNARKRVILERSGFPSEADLATLEETVQYTLYDKYNWKEERTVRQQVLTYAGKKQLSDLKFTFNPVWEQIKLMDAAVTAPDGKTKYIDPEKEINVMDAGWVGEAPRYPAEKILVASLPGVEIGSIIEYQTVSIHRGLPFFSAGEYFSGHNPIVRKTVRVELPYKMDMMIKSPDLYEVKQTVRGGNGTVIREWSVKNRAMVKKEENLPPYWTFQPAVFFSCGDADDYVALVEKTLLNAAGQNNTAKAKSRELTKDLKTRDQKIAALRDFVDRIVRAAGPDFAALPLSAVTSADQVLAEGYGNTTDRAVLLYALLDAAGLKPRFILSSSTLPRRESTTMLVVEALQRSAFDTVLVAATGDKKKTIYLGDTGQYAQLGALAHNNQPTLNLKTGHIENPQTEISDSVETDFTMNLSETGDIALTKKIIFSGVEYEAFHKEFAQFTPEDRKRAHQSLLSQISQSAEAVGDLQTSFADLGQLQFAANLPAYAVRDGNQMYFNLPEGLGDLLSLKTSRRENPFYIEKPTLQTFLYKISLPAGWEPVLLPASSRTELPDGAGWVNVTVSADAGQISIRQEAQLNAAIIPPENYDKLQALNNLLTAPSARAVLLRKK